MIGCLLTRSFVYTSGLLTAFLSPDRCFLVTYYFIHAMLPRLMCAEKTDDDGPESEKGKDDIVVFMGEYGSYLKMDTCLAYAAALKADSVVDILLSIAKHDPRHREVIKQTTKSTTMVFYEPVSCDDSDSV